MHRVVAQLKRRLKTQGHENRGAQAPRARRRAPHDARVAGDRRRAGGPEVPPGAPAPARALRALRRVDERHERVGLLPLRACTRCTTRSARCARSSSSSAISEVTDVFERERDFKAVTEAIGRDAGVADISGYTDYGRVWREFRDQVEDELHPRATVIVLGDARTNGRDPRADVFAADRREGRPHVLAEPRAAAVLELRRLGDPRVRAVLRGVRVLDHRAARGVRQGADGAGRGAALTVLSPVVR